MPSTFVMLPLPNKKNKSNSYENLVLAHLNAYYLAMSSSGQWQKKLLLFRLLKYEYWKSQSRTKVMTTASPVGGLDLNKLNQRAIASA